MGFRNSLPRLGAALVLTAAAMLPATSLAAPGRDLLVDGARLCTQQFPVQERAQNIPTHLLAAISSTESGRWHKQLDMALPWPWTINVEGKGYYFDSKAEAIAQTQAFMRKGARSIDVGCMQVNLKHHAKAFRNLEEAFDPATNVAYAAKFLRTNYNDLGDWIKATAAYHSRTPRYGNAYLVRIEKNWSRIVTKVAEARKNQGLAPQAAMKADFRVADNSAAPAASAPAAQQRKMNPIASTRNVRLIQVSNSTPRSAADVMVVRTPETPTPIRVADATPAIQSDMMVKTTDSIQYKRLGVDSSGASSNSAAGSTGPKFVFAN